MDGGLLQAAVKYYKNTCGAIFYRLLLSFICRSNVGFTWAKRAIELKILFKMQVFCEICLGKVKIETSNLSQKYVFWREYLGSNDNIYKWIRIKANYINRCIL